MQVLGASVVDMLQAGIHQQQPEAVGNPAATPGPVHSRPEALPTSNAQPSSQVSGTASLLADAAGSSSSSPLQLAEPASEPGPESALERSCIFEVEVVLTATGTKLTPSISQFLVCHPYLFSVLIFGMCRFPSPLVALHMHGTSPSNGFRGQGIGSMVCFMGSRVIGMSP